MTERVGSTKIGWLIVNTTNTAICKIHNTSKNNNHRTSWEKTHLFITTNPTFHATEPQKIRIPKQKEEKTEYEEDCTFQKAATGGK